MQKHDCYQKVKDLTRTLVKIPSVSKEPGQESDVAKYIYSKYQELDYFKKNPSQVRLFETQNDFMERHSVLSWIRGTKGNSNRAVLLIGHTDTVGIEDYGVIKEWACDPDMLPEKLLTLDLSEEIVKDIKSGEFMFGRGALDMKSGVAGHMYLMEYYSQHPEELDGVLVALHECDEEDAARGMLSAIPLLIDLKKEQNLEYISCINADYSTNYNPGDENRYIYYGCIGKVLPCFYAFGKETHVGQAFGGLDPNLILSQINCDMALNVDFSDIDMGEVAIPPISLKLADTKEGYTVQTAISSLLCMNAFTHKWLPREVMDKCKNLAEQSFDTVVENLNKQYKKFCEVSKIDYKALPWKTKVVTWEEFYGELKKKYGKEFEDAIAAFADKLNKEQPDMDLRMFSCRVIDEAWKWQTDKSPCVVIFLGSNFHTHCGVAKEDGPYSANLLDAVEKAVEAVRPDAKRELKTRMFYPYIADTSFIVAPKEDVTPTLQNNMPSWNLKYFYDIESTREIDMPTVNIGTFGRDGHMLTERVDMWHTFQNVPNITYLTINELLK